MIIKSYHFKWENGCDFAAALEDTDASPDVIEKVEDQINDRYHTFAPYGPKADDTIVFASRFEQDVMDVIDAWDADATGVTLEFDVVEVETDE